jgi:hypothetical protein
VKTLLMAQPPPLEHRETNRAKLRSPAEWAQILDAFQTLRFKLGKALLVGNPGARKARYLN